MSDLNEEVEVDAQDSTAVTDLVEETAVEDQGHTATVNYDDGQIRFWPKHRLDKEDYEMVRSKIGLKWKRAEQCFMGAWSPRREDALLKKFGCQMEVDDTDLLEVAHGRAEYYERYSGNAAKRSESSFNTAHQIVSAIPPGQPILVGHHSEGHHRRDLARHDAGMRKGFVEKEKATHWAGRAGETIRRTERRYERGPLANRIKDLEADIRKFKRNFADAKRQSDRNWWLRWLDFSENRLAMAQMFYKETLPDGAAVNGDVPPEEFLTTTEHPLEKGGGLQYGSSWYEIVRINKKTVTVKYWLGHEKLTWKVPYPNIKATLSKAEWESTRKVLTGVGFILPVPKPTEES